jgi:electron transport complex protein RnfD
MSDTEIRLPEASRLLVSSSPHAHSGESVRGIMLTVVVALLPACVAGALVFGPRALLLVAVCAGSAVGFEALLARWLGRAVRIADGSALLTGLLLGLNLGAGTPLWMAVVGSLIAIGLGKMIYGGLGYNPFNPALIGRVALLLAFPAALTTWVKPCGPLAWARTVDGMTAATPLGRLAELKAWVPSQVLSLDGQPLTLADCFLGGIGGCIGETSALALLIGGAILLARRVIRWQVPVAFIGTVALITAVAHMASPERYAPASFHLVTGGLLLGAIFMATDMVTSPMGRLGGFVFGLGCGVITCVIRLWGSYPEGVSFSILIMNAMTPLIDRWTGGRPFGSVAAKGAVP